MNMMRTAFHGLSGIAAMPLYITSAACVPTMVVYIAGFFIALDAIRCNFEPYLPPLKYIFQLDELTIFLSALGIFFSLAVRPKSVALRFDMVFALLATHVFLCLVSGIANQNDPIRTLCGIIEMDKGFTLVVFLSWYRFSRDDLETAKKWFIRLAIAAAIGAFGEEIHALASGMPNQDGIFGIFYRVNSFLELHTLLGLLLFLALNFIGTELILRPGRQGRRIYLYLFLLSGGIIFSNSRMALIALSIFVLTHILLNIKWTLKRILILGLFLLIFTLGTFQVYKRFLWEFEAYQGMRADYMGSSVRTYGYMKGIDVLTDHLFIGSGPGTFGSTTSFHFRTDDDIYEKYNFDKEWYLPFMTGMKGIDSAWPIIYTETGLLGLGLFFLMQISIFLRCRRAKKFFRRDRDFRMESTALAMMINWLTISSLAVGSGINFGGFLFLISIFTGIMNSVYRLRLQNKRLQTKNELEFCHGSDKVAQASAFG